MPITRPTAVWLARMAAALVVGLMTAPAVFCRSTAEGGHPGLRHGVWD